MLKFQITLQSEQTHARPSPLQPVQHCFPQSPPTHSRQLPGTSWYPIPSTPLDSFLKARLKQRKAILCCASDDLVGAISAIALSPLKGNIPLKHCEVSVQKTMVFIKKWSDKLSLKRQKLYWSFVKLCSPPTVRTFTYLIMEHALKNVSGSVPSARTIEKSL